MTDKETYNSREDVGSEWLAGTDDNAFIETPPEVADDLFYDIITDFEKRSGLFSDRVMGDDMRMSLFDAIRHNQTALYLGDHASEKEKELVSELGAIYTALSDSGSKQSRDMLHRMKEKLDDYLLQTTPAHSA